MKIIVFGAAGSGKGSLAKMLARDYSIPHISSGEIFRENMKSGTPLGLSAEKYVLAGQLVPDIITAQVISNRLEADDCLDGYLLDGFPRTFPQAQMLGDLTDIDYVIHIIVTEETALARLAGRYMCRNCQIIHNSRWDDVSKCRVCESELYQRDDDKENVIRKRLEDYQCQVTPILDYFRDVKNCRILEVQSNLEDTPEHVYDRFMGLYKSELEDGIH